MKIRVVVAREGEEAHIEYIEDTLKAMQEIVGGYIEGAVLSDDPGWILYVNEEGKINGKCLPNRNLSIFGLNDTVFGPILATGVGEEGETVSLPENIAHYIARILNIVGRQNPLTNNTDMLTKRSDDLPPDDFTETDVNENLNSNLSENSNENSNENETSKESEE